MDIEILRKPEQEDWQRCKMLALSTVWKTSASGVSDEWKRRMLIAEHSPIRTLPFTIRMSIPYYVSCHFARHKVGVEHYVSTQRNDRQAMYDRKAARQDCAVTHVMDINAAALIGMARKRLCYKAAPETRRVMEEIRDEVVRLCPEFDGLLIPSCEYRGLCPEWQSCGKIRGPKNGRDDVRARTA